MRKYLIGTVFGVIAAIASVAFAVNVDSNGGQLSTLNGSTLPSSIGDCVLSAQPNNSTGTGTLTNNCALWTFGALRLNNGSTYEAWRTALSNPPGTTGTQIAAVTTFQGSSESLNISSATQVKSTGARLFRINVVTAGSTTGQACDVLGSCAAANVVFTIPNVTGSYEINWPCASALKIEPGTGQVVAVAYN